MYLSPILDVELKEKIELWKKEKDKKKSEQ